MGKKIKPSFGFHRPPRQLKEHIFTVNNPQAKCALGFSYGKYKLVLCSQCLAKREKAITWNRTRLANGAYDSHYATNPPDVDYSSGRIIPNYEDAECYDCGYKIKGR